MSYNVDGYETRASECVWLADLTDDELVRSELLKLCQAYLHIALRLREQGFRASARPHIATASALDLVERWRIGRYDAAQIVDCVMKKGDVSNAALGHRFANFALPDT